MIGRERHGVVLVDDEALGRQRLRQLLHASPDFEVVGECDDARRIMDLVLETRPAVAFLDVQMPHVDGFAAHESIRSLVRHVVFVTAHSQHAARAFDVAASDYLVKPVTQARFDAALDRVRATLAGDARPRILLGGRQGGVAVPLADIAWARADGAYVVVQAAGKEHVLRETLSEFLERCGAGRFVRIHRGAGVSVAHIRALRRPRAAQVEVELIDRTRLPVSRRQVRDVLIALGRAQPHRLQHEPTVDAADD